MNRNQWITDRPIELKVRERKSKRENWGITSRGGGVIRVMGGGLETVRSSNLGGRERKERERERGSERERT